MKIDIVYIDNELVVNLSGIFKDDDLLEVERRVDIILNDYDITNIKFNTDDVLQLHTDTFNNLIKKYHNKLKKA